MTEISIQNINLLAEPLYLASGQTGAMDVVGLARLMAIHPDAPRAAC